MLHPLDPDGGAGLSELSERSLGFLRYWRSKRGDGRFPRRADIDPAEVPELLPYLFMLDVIPGAPLDFRFRLVGTQIVRIEGECTGKLLSEMFPDRVRYVDLWRQYVDAVEGRLWVRHETLAWQDRDFIRYEVVLAPLEDEDGAVVMLIGCAHG